MSNAAMEKIRPLYGQIDGCQGSVSSMDAIVPGFNGSPPRAYPPRT